MATPQATPAQAPSAPERSGKKIPLLIGALLLLLGGGGLVGYLRLGRAQAAQEKSAPVEIDPGLADLDAFALNLPDEDHDRHLRVGLRIALDQADVAAEINEQGLGYTRLRDRILSLLAACSAVELGTDEGREALRADVARTVGPLLEEPPFCEEGEQPARVLEVFFSEFLVQ